jgi:hypothetical protein
VAPSQAVCLCVLWDEAMELDLSLDRPEGKYLVSAVEEGIPTQDWEDSLQ